MKHQDYEGDVGANRMAVLLVGLVLGGLTGAIAMLLLAPRSGKQMRTQLQKQGAKLRHDTVEGVEDMVNEAGSIAHDFTDGVNKGVDEVQKHAQSVLDVGKKK